MLGACSMRKVSEEPGRIPLSLTAAASTKMTMLSLVSALPIYQLHANFQHHSSVKQGLIQ